MALPFVNVSILTSGNSAPGGARNFSYLRILNTDWSGSGSTATSAYAFRNANNVSFGTSGSNVTATASFSSLEFRAANNIAIGTVGNTVTLSASYGHVAAARSDALREIGIFVASESPSNPCQYSQWLIGSNGYWAWISIP